MSPGARTLCRFMPAIAALFGAIGASAQVTVPDAVDAGAPDVSELEQYLSGHGLRELLAAHLLQRLKASDAAGRKDLADRLGKLYVEMLDSAPTAEARARWQDRSIELLSAVPEADSFDLRLNLAKVSYLRAEEIAERSRLLLASPEEMVEAQAILRGAVLTFQDIATKANRRVDAGERREAAGRDEDTNAVRAALAEARRLRSQAMYYAGWSNYYLALLTGRPQTAEEALTQFGWLLNASGGKSASLERLPTTLLRYEHVARAAIGSALCESIRGRDDTAIRWLEALETGEDIPPTVLAQVFARRLVVLATAGRWADLELITRRARVAMSEGKVSPLPLGESRLLAVLTLSALEAGSVAPHAQELVRKLAEGAMTDLISLGEARHVLDLVKRFGTAPLSGEGFIVNYVRGLQAYDRAREIHKSSGEDPEQPTSNNANINTYREAAASMNVAMGSADAARFSAESTNAGFLLGLSLYYAGELEQAADRFERVYQSGADRAVTEEALWLAVVALDRAVEKGKPSLTERRNRTSTLFLRTFPKTERAAKLLLRSSGSGLVTEQDAVETLLGVPPSSPVYTAARSHAASLLYSIYRRARGANRDFAALRFVEVAEEVLHGDEKDVRVEDARASQEAVTRVITRVRQILDAVLGMSAPDLPRAERALQVLDGVAAYASVSLADVEDELTFRRLQIAIAKGDQEEIARRLDRLSVIGGRFADTAARLLYRGAVARWTSAPDDGSAKEVVRHGLVIIGQYAEGPGPLADPAVYNLNNTVAAAAAALWASTGDAAMRDVALRIDRKLVGSGTPPAAVLRRYAETSESAGDASAALDAWRMLLTGLGQTTPGWFEARYHSLRLLADADPVRARQAMDQHKLLYPGFGPEPWGPRLRELDERLSKIGPPPETPGGGP